MIDHKELLEAALTAARKGYILEPSLHGKKEWFRVITLWLTELQELKTAEKH